MQIVLLKSDNHETENFRTIHRNRDIIRATPVLNTGQTHLDFWRSSALSPGKLQGSTSNYATTVAFHISAFIIHSSQQFPLLSSIQFHK